MNRAAWMLLLGLLAACSREALPEVPPAGGEGERPAREAWGVAFDVHDGTRPRVRLDAPYMATFERDTLFHLLSAAPDSAPGRVVADLFDDAGRPSARLTADTLRYYERDRRFVAVGGVIVTTEEGRRLETERLTWLEATAEITAPGFVHIVSPDEDVRGYGLTAHETLFPYRLGRVTAQISVDE